jgi:hypothetical protein
LDYSIFEEGQPTSVADLSSLRALAEEVRDLERTKEDLENETKVINARLTELTQKLLPEAMASLGMDNFSLSDGSKISVKDFVSGTVNKAPDKDAALVWISENGGESLIKTEVKMNFGKGEDNRAKNAIGLLVEQGYDVESDKTVHPQTLASFAREKLAAGDDIPLADLGLFAGRHAKIALGKGKKK